MANYADKNHYPAKLIDANGDENDSSHPLYTSGDLQVGGAAASATNPVPTKQSGTPVVTKATGGGAIALTYTNSAAPFWLDSVTVRLSAAPALAGTLSATLDSAEGAAYDIVIGSTDPSTAAATDIVITPASGPLLCAAGDAIVVAYANPSAVTYGAIIRTRAV